jgi:hypothetical protein
VAPIRIQFTATKNLATAPNTLDLRITNLAEGTRRQLKERDAQVQLEAGYTDDWTTTADGRRVLPTLFLGNARTIDHVREGPDWVTHIQCGDGEVTSAFAQLSWTWGAGQTVADVARKLAETLKDFAGDVDVSSFLAQLKIPAGTQGAVEGADRILQHGKSIAGNAMFELQALFPKHQVSIQTGELRVLRAPTGGVQPGVSSSSVILLSPETGLIGSPEHGTPDHSGLPTVLKARSLLIARAHPGDQVALRSAQFDGTYQAMKVTHVGDSAGPIWQSDYELRPLQVS